MLNYEFPPVGGGGGRVAEDLCRGLAARGHQVQVLTSLVAGLPHQEWRDGFEVVRLPAGRSRLDRCTPREMAAYVGLGAGPVLRAVYRFRPDLVHAHFAVPTGALAWLVRRTAGTPYVLTAHLGDVPGGVPEQTGQLFRWVKPLTVPIWRAAAYRTAVSEFTRRLAERAYGLPVETVYNGVGVSECRPGPALPPRSRRLVFAGRFSVQKNVLFLIDALAQVRDQDWTMRMLGDGPLRAPVEARVAALGLTDRVRLEGWVGPARVDEVLADSDVLLLPSLSEGLSVVGIRALAFGVAVLASDAGGNLDLVEPGVNGHLCPVGDLRPFVERLRQMLAAGEELAGMKRASRRRALAFDLLRIVDRYEQIFLQVRTPGRAAA